MKFSSEEFLQNLLRMLSHTIINLLGLSHYIIEPEITWPKPESESKSISATLIQEMLPVMKYSDVARTERVDGPESCVVCMYEFREHELIRRLRNCKHIFHKGCVDRWMEHDQMSCPLCRTSFVPDHLLDFFNQRLEEESASCSSFPDFGSEFSVINHFS